MTKKLGSNTLPWLGQGKSGHDDVRYQSVNAHTLFGFLFKRGF